MNKFIDIQKYTSYAHDIAIALSSFGGGPLGFRNAGSVAEHKAAKFIEAEMLHIGLAEVACAPFPSDIWEYRSATLSYSVNAQKKAVNLAPFASGGVGTIDAELIYAGRGTRQDCDKINVSGKIALIEIDMRNEWWINYPAYQLMLRGALAVIVSCVSGYAESNENAYVTNDFCGAPGIPVFSISAAIARELRSLCGHSVSLLMDNAVTSGGISHNVSGKITGSQIPNELIILGAHYDAHFTGFQDNAVAVGQILAMAKAFVENDIKPNRTIVFIAHGAEEWGAIDTRYDWCIGSWNQAFRLHPEWAGKAVVNLNFEMTALPHFSPYALRSDYELATFLSETLPKNVEIVTPLRTWSDDFSYSIAGIPALVNAFDRHEFMKTSYHTDFDTPETWNPESMAYYIKTYSNLTLAFDKSSFPPLDFSVRFSALKASLPENPMVDTLIAESKALYENLKSSDVWKSAAHSVISESLLKIYKRLQDSFVRLNWFAEPIFEHCYYSSNIIALQKAISASQQNRSPAEFLMEIDDSYYDAFFDKEVIQNFKRQALSQPDDRMFWGGGRFVDSLDLFDIINSTENNNARLSKLQTLLDDQRAKYEISVKKAFYNMEQARIDIQRVFNLL